MLERPARTAAPHWASRDRPALHQVPLGAVAEVSGLDAEGLLRQRLLDLGFVPGAAVRPVRRSLLGDPTAYEVMGALIALRRDEASRIRVRDAAGLAPRVEPAPATAVATAVLVVATVAPAAGSLAATPVGAQATAHAANARAPRPVVALAGNPNTGKSTVFNALTGSKQHTGNWPGKTVARREGLFSQGGREMVLVDLPGAYSLRACSPEEAVARDFICFGRPDATVVVVDATCLERNLNLVLQVAEVTPRVVVCLNLMDEAAHKGFRIDVPVLAAELGLPVVPTVARDGTGLLSLAAQVHLVASGELRPRPWLPRYAPALEDLIQAAEAEIASFVDGRLDRRWVALRLVEGDRAVLAAIAAQAGGPSA